MTEAKEGAMTSSAVLTTVSDPKLSSESPEEVTATDNSNEFDDEAMEGKENSAAVSKIDNKSSTAATSKSDSETSSPVELDTTKTIDLQTATNLEPFYRKRTIIRTRSRRRKRSLGSRAVLPTPVLSFAATLTNTQRQKSPPQSEGDSLASQDDTRTNKETALEQESRINDKHQDDSSMENSKTGKRPNPNASTENATPTNKKQKIQQESESLNPEKSPINQMEIEEGDEKESTPSERPDEDALDSPSRETQFKLPPELAPFNNPGVCDYGVIRASRLRNRKKKAIENDVPYQNIQGQRRCRATRDGKKMIGPGNTNRCLNCAEGVFKYCHTHHDLDEDQKVYWENRKRRDSQIGSESSYAAKGKMPTKESSVKAETVKAESVKTESKSMKSTMHRSIATTQKQCVQVPGEVFEKNEPRRCVALVQGKGRCFRKMLTTEPTGFCYSHLSLVEKLNNWKMNKKYYAREADLFRCTAVSRVGTKCKFKALDGCVFCLTHMNSPPGLVCSTQEHDSEENTDSILKAKSMGGKQSTTFLRNE